MNMNKWKECMFWLPDDKPSSTVAVVVVNKKGKVKRLPYKHWNEKNKGYSERKLYTYVQSDDRGKQRHEVGVDVSKGKYKHINIRGKAYSVHRLVAKAWVPNPDNKAQVNHIDGNRSNNHYKNLEWVTNKENAKHAHDLGMRNHVYEGNIKLTDDIKDTIRGLYLDGYTSPEIGDKTSLSHETVRVYLLNHYGEALVRNGNLTKFLSAPSTGVRFRNNKHHIAKTKESFLTFDEVIEAKTKIAEGSTKRDLELWQNTLKLHSL